MTTNKALWPRLGRAFGLLAIAALAGIALLVFLTDEIAEQGWPVFNAFQSYFPFRAAWQDNSGNEFTGVFTAWLFGLACAPVALDLVARAFLCHAPAGETLKGFIRRTNALQRKYLLPFHTYLSILALGLGIFHLGLSSCLANPFPEWGLLLSGILVATGLMFKWKTLPNIFRKVLYRFHTSLLVSGLLAAILLVGHSIMGMD